MYPVAPQAVKDLLMYLVQLFFVPTKEHERISAVRQQMFPLVHYYIIEQKEIYLGLVVLSL
jgi:hypothetical protein